MSAYCTPLKKRSGFIGDTSTVDYSAALNGSCVRYDDLKSRFNDIINDVNDKNDDTNRGVTEVANANRALASYLREQQQIDIQNLEGENIQLRKKLNSELKQNNQLMALIAQLEDEADQLSRRVTADKNLEGENGTLKTLLLKQNNDYNKLYYELELLKNEGDRIRKQTKSILLRRISS